MALRSRLTASGYSRAAVDVAVAGADRVGGDRHPLEDPVRVALEDAPVHERAGVALVGVADDVPAEPVGLGDGVPLEAGRVAGAAAAAQAAPGDLLAHLGGRHRRERLPERLVAADSRRSPRGSRDRCGPSSRSRCGLAREERRPPATRSPRASRRRGRRRSRPGRRAGRARRARRSRGSGRAARRHTGPRQPTRLTATSVVPASASRVPSPVRTSCDWADRQLTASQTYADARAGPSTLGTSSGRRRAARSGTGGGAVRS